MPKAVSIFKFVGTISLGLLTGTSYTLTTATLPSLLALPTAQTCSTALTHLTRYATLHRRILSNVAWASLALAYAVSPRHAKHPYLLWTGLATLTADFAPTFALRVRKRVVVGEEEDGVGAGRTGEEDVNGETVRRDVVRWRKVEAVRAGLAGTAFAMAVVGIWGDGF
ncbi:hypothetical protein EJ05DRAFT_496127 [Pseudovirgaria hyperparasitica]|uniref:DUF1772-domain-containing protein n=1 Tax=Pseudovirgaria hyperparasitica TaxID=470096 RepID=A0A6A6WM58_9PEZI|nr:uncharacterized protein EJ05DRAFT_496127 [Pseudovirgaria hyperparasitica]KAF2763300.1 hypothetical protein EJ05DRAFT_496127 [Pseudovirgaria hyperparasitica]